MTDRPRSFRLVREATVGEVRLRERDRGRSPRRRRGDVDGFLVGERLRVVADPDVRSEVVVCEQIRSLRDRAALVGHVSSSP
nr:hypothetical protein [Halorubrum trapanicum]